MTCCSYKRIGLNFECSDKVVNLNSTPDKVFFNKETGEVFNENNELIGHGQVIGNKLSFNKNTNEKP